MTRDDVAQILANTPDLNAEGIGLSNIHGRLASADRAALVRQNQESLLNDLESCNRAYRWLRSREKLKSINKKHSSYELKHMTEKEVGYVTNGAFIAAAIYLGFTFEANGDSPNVWLNISEKSLKNPILTALS